jgi:hypothetical protein
LIKQHLVLIFTPLLQDGGKKLVSEATAILFQGLFVGTDFQKSVTKIGGTDFLFQILGKN